MEEFLKKVKLNESKISMILGVLVIAVVGILVVNYFRSQDGDTSSDATSTEAKVDETMYIVQPGDNLSRIADKYYGDRLKWLPIAEANDITDPNLLEKGQELTIPVLTDATVSTNNDEMGENDTSPSSTPLETPTATSVVSVTPKIASDTPETSPGSYEVQSGDTLWSIATSAYGDGYKWVDIAKANSLDNPNVIHHGNVLVLPQ